jgi:hypothetical protein
MTLRDILDNDLIERIRNHNEKEVNPESSRFSSDADLTLFHKWAYKVEKGWYGFDLGNKVPYCWVLAIDKVLKKIEELDPEFTIQQIKLKYGQLCFYIDYNKNIDEINQLAKELLELCCSRHLIY